MPQIDIVVSLMFSHPKEKSVALLENANIPVIRAISLYNEVEEWEKNPQGITTGPTGFPDLSAGDERPCRADCRGG